MTDKEVIIDGVNIDKCKFKSSSILGSKILCNISSEEQNGNIIFKECRECSNCEFKQLQKAKEKCNSPILQNKKDIIHLCEALINKTLKFWEENQKLKDEIKLYKQQLDKIERIATYIQEDRYDVGYRDILDKINYIKYINEVIKDE